MNALTIDEQAQAILEGMQAELNAPRIQRVCLARGKPADLSKPIEYRVFQAVGCALTLMRKANVPAGVAIQRAAIKYDVHQTDVASHMGQRSAVKRAGGR